jgi:hypothetical protein
VPRSGRNVARARRVFVTHNGLGPWTCNECNELIVQIGRTSDDGNIHHVDEDPSNDVPENLVILHTTCHQKLHHFGETHSAEHNAKVGRPGREITWHDKVGRRGRVITPEWRAKLGVKSAAYHASLTPEQKAERTRKAWETRRRKAESCTPT